MTGICCLSAHMVAAWLHMTSGALESHATLADSYAQIDTCMGIAEDGWSNHLLQTGLWVHKPLQASGQGCIMVELRTHH